MPPPAPIILGRPSSISCDRPFANTAARFKTWNKPGLHWKLRCRRAVAENEQIRGILSGLPEPILAVDHFDDLVLVNSSAEQLFQLDGQNVANRAAKNLLRCQKLVDLLLAAAHHKTTGSRSEEIEIADAAGQSSWYRVTAARLAAEADSGAAEPSGGAVAVLRNIADQKVLQKRNAEFVSSVSHEMKTPLAGIKAYVELLADGDAEDEATREEFLGVISGQADRLQRLVENLLNLARIEAGVVKVSKEPRSLNAILEEALNVVQPSAESKNIRLGQRPQPALPVGAGRPRHAPASGNQPLVQRGQVHASRRPGDPPQPHGRGPGAVRGAGHRRGPES